MTAGLVRYYGTRHLHFITCSCYHRKPRLHDAARYDLLLTILEEARQKYHFVVHGYVLMPEHFHLLITEPELGNPSVVMKVVKERFTLQLNQRRKAAHAAPIWQKRFYDFNVWSEKKRIEKLRYMHRNPVKRGLVTEPDQWKWSSFRAYRDGEIGLLRVNYQEWPVRIKALAVEKFGARGTASLPLIRKKRE
ncbi:MAG TPA: transposase [Terriglobales bacterium]